MQSQTRNYNHPFKPYGIQLEFMNALYNCIENRQVGIFESPTGTGKSLSLICGSLTWLRNSQLTWLNTETGSDSEDDPEWIAKHAKAEKLQNFLKKKQRLAARLRKIKADEIQQKERYETAEPVSKRTKISHAISKPSIVDEEQEFLLKDYESETEETRSGARNELGMSEASLDLAAKLGMVFKSDAEDEIEAEDSTKIFYCSRTHSQLTQFANEVRRIKIPMPRSEHGLTSDDGEHDLADEIKHLALGSRKNLCINKHVNRLGNPTAINERCLDLQQTKTPKDKKCMFLPKKENQTLVHQFRDLTLAKIRDIEDLGELGRKISICPYYASRATIKPSEIVTLPYPLLLQKSSRDTLNISLNNHIVIIDEAHNLMDAISGMYSVEISLEQLKRAREQIGIYLQKFRNKLKGKNRVYVTQTVRLIDSLITFLQKFDQQTAAANDGVINLTDLLAGKGVDQINLYKLSTYLQESKLARKVDGYALYLEKEKPKDEVPIVSPVLNQVQSFFQALTYPAAEGRFFYAKEDDAKDISLKYLLLDPTNSFRDIVEEARAVILAGGTMSPMEDYKLHLFPYLDPAKLATLSCGHVIPDENLIVLPFSKGPANGDLDFTYEKRSSPIIIQALGLALVQLSKIIPDGLVVFFPSYAYLAQVTSLWKQRRAKETPMWNQLERLKPIFEESKGSASVEDVLSKYSMAINGSRVGKGALLLSVVGGKMSEGINFSDRLGRGVVIVGLPFPNIQSPEWKAKLEYIEQQTVSRGDTTAEAKNAARAFYENACMRAVNQSIGRAIRHQNDYAAIIMLDRRYSTQRIQEKLPSWIKKGLVQDSGSKDFGQAMESINRFFEAKTKCL